MPFKDITQEYEVQKDETVLQLWTRVEKDQGISWNRWWHAKLHQDDRQLCNAVKLRKTNVDVKRPLVYTRG